MFFANDTKIRVWQSCALSPAQVAAHSSASAEEQSEFISVKPSTPRE